MANEWVAKEAKFQKRDLKLALRFAEEHEDKFDDKFIQSINKDFEQNGYLTEGQYRALRNTIDGWHMEDWADREGIDVERL